MPGGCGPQKILLKILFPNDGVDAILYNKMSHFILKDQSKSSKIIIGTPSPRGRRDGSGSVPTMIFL